MTRRATFALLSALLLSSPLPSHAQPAPASPREDTKQRARLFYEAAEAYYQAKEYSEALRGYQSAYELTRAPALLFNMAQCYRLLDQKREALAAYREFLVLSPDTRYRAEIEERIATLERELAPPPPPSLAAPAPLEAPAPAPKRGLPLPYLLPGAAALVGSVSGLIALHLEHSLHAQDQGSAEEALLQRRDRAALVADLSFVASGVSLFFVHRRLKAAKAAGGGE